MWLLHPTQAEGVLCQTAAQRRTLSAVKALISGAFLRVKRVRANYLTSAFPKFLEDHGLRRMRFHDLRHSCASLRLANGVPLKHIQEWLGHSDFTITANICAHLDYKSKTGDGDRASSPGGWRLRKSLEGGLSRKSGEKNKSLL